MNVEFELQGELTFKDHLQVALFQSKKLFLMNLLTILLAYYLLLPSGTVPAAYRWAALLFFLLLGTVVMLIAIFMRVKKEYSSLSKRFHEKAIEIDEEGLRYGSKDSAAHFKWSDIKRVDFPKGMLLLYISTNQALLIPGRFFPSKEEEEACIAFIRKSSIRINLSRGRK